ncbi:MAG: hypothetical protein OEZ30_09885 [Candidatus Aminicenantes bacterium]|nr:hypothetical protein [Candidatus Aminicenantes bacterium]
MKKAARYSLILLKILTLTLDGALIHLFVDINGSYVIYFVYTEWRYEERC